nr:hypothetical protein [Chloroflexota bacterium]
MTKTMPAGGHGGQGAGGSPHPTGGLYPGASGCMPSRSYNSTQQAASSFRFSGVPYDQLTFYNLHI